MIEKYKNNIIYNQELLRELRLIKSINPKWLGTMDYAVARYNTILLFLINKPLQLDSHVTELKKIQGVIGNFAKWVKRYYVWPWYAKIFPNLIIKYIGKYEIPKIKKLLKTLRN